MLKVSIDSSNLDTKWRKIKAEKIEREMETIVNSDLFRELVLAIKYKHGETSYWRDAPNQEIYDHIISGKETLNPIEDGEIDIVIDDYYTWRRVIGYTYPNIQTIYTNTKYFDSENLSPERHHRKMSGSNAMHEYGHKLGFDHDFRATSRRKYSLCYLLNDIYEQCWDELIAPTMKRAEREYTYRRWFRTYKVLRVELHDV